MLPRPLKTSLCHCPCRDNRGGQAGSAPPRTRDTTGSLRPPPQAAWAPGDHRLEATMSRGRELALPLNAMHVLCKTPPPRRTSRSQKSRNSPDLHLTQHRAEGPTMQQEEPSGKRHGAGPGPSKGGWASMRARIAEALREPLLLDNEKAHRSGSHPHSRAPRGCLPLPHAAAPTTSLSF